MAKAKKRSGKKAAAKRGKKVTRRKTAARRSAKRKPASPAAARVSPRPVVIPGAWPFPMASKPQARQQPASGLTWRSGSVERKRINASNIRSVGYDAGQQLLEIEFTSGSVVQYAGVSPEVHRRFMSAPSPGSFYQDHIDENFPSKRVR